MLQKFCNFDKPSHLSNSPYAVVGILHKSIIGADARKVDSKFTARTARNAPINLEVAGTRMQSDCLSLLLPF